MIKLQGINRKGNTAIYTLYHETGEFAKFGDIVNGAMLVDCEPPNGVKLSDGTLTMVKNGKSNVITPEDINFQFLLEG